MYIETSASEGTNINQLFETIFEIADEKITSKNTRMISINLDDENGDMSNLRNGFNCCKLL